jgi:hypothetical protein
MFSGFLQSWPVPCLGLVTQVGSIVDETGATGLTQSTGKDRMPIEARLDRGIKMSYGAITRFIFSRRCAPARWTLAARRTLFLHAFIGGAFELAPAVAMRAMPTSATQSSAYPARTVLPR